MEDDTRLRRCPGLPRSGEGNETSEYISKKSENMAAANKCSSPGCFHQYRPAEELSVKYPPWCVLCMS